MKGEVLIEFRNRKLNVYFDYSHDPGVHTYSNGDPGHPPHTEFQINLVENEKGVDLQPLLDRFDKMHETKEGIWEELSTAVLESEEFDAWDSEDDEDCEPDDFEPDGDWTHEWFDGT